MKKHLSTAALILALLAGVSLLLYPTVSNYWNARHASRAVANYTQEVQALDRDAYDRMLAEAAAYNRSLLTRENAFALTDAQQAQYDRLLDIRDNYPKYILRTDDFVGGNYEGIQTMHVADFLLSDAF